MSCQDLTPGQVILLPENPYLLFPIISNQIQITETGSINSHKHQATRRLYSWTSQAPSTSISCCWCGCFLLRAQGRPHSITFSVELQGSQQTYRLQHLRQVHFQTALQLDEEAADLRMYFSIFWAVKKASIIHLRSGFCRVLAPSSCASTCLISHKLHILAFICLAVHNK